MTTKKKTAVVKKDEVKKDDDTLQVKSHDGLSPKMLAIASRRFLNLLDLPKAEDEKEEQ